MRTLEVVGLEDEGPADIVGALVGEAGVDADAVGEIEVEDGRARVEVAEDAAPAVLEAVDGSRVGRARVRVRPADEAAPVRAYVDRWTGLVELERDAEMREHEAEIRRLSGPEREARGRALVRMRGTDKGEGLGGHLVRFTKADGGGRLPEHELSVGDLAMVSRRDPLRDDNPTGTVARRTRYSVTVALDEKPPDWATGTGLRLDLYVNDITYQRMLAALERIDTAEGRLAELREVLVGRRAPAEPEPTSVDAFHDAALDATQREAVTRALGAPDLHLVHGPPGTGKTTTVAEVAAQLVDHEEAVLATAASNTAVDNVVEALVDEGVHAVRVGHPARVTATLREHTLDALVEDEDAFRQRQRLRERAFELKDEQEALTKPVGRWRRGMSDEQIRRLADEGRGSRGVPPERIEEMAGWLDREDRIDELFARADALEQEALDAVLDAAEVVCTTNSSAGGELLAGRAFDALVLDEATQATEPSCLIPLVKADRAVLAGDPRQRPPPVKSREAEREGLARTLFERLADEHPAVVDQLGVQYRMHEAIMAYPARRFYDGALEADASVADHTLEELGLDLAEVDGLAREALAPTPPLALVDTAELEAPERSPPGSRSRENPREAALVAEIARAALAAGLDVADVGVITPYAAQRDRLRRDLDAPGLEVDTVDGFQGREKELVLVSFVRSNPTGELGFLTDLRRLNVAITRARRKLVLVGDAGTLATHPTYAGLIDHVRGRGRVLEPS